MKFSLLLLLSICLFQTVYSQPDSEEEPAVLRKTGCSNPKFVAAELKAYQELVAERARIDKWRTDTITLIEATKKDHLDLASRRYSTTLNGCKDAECSTGAKVKYDGDVKSIYDICDKDLKTVRRKAAEKYEEAQDDYDKAVDAAIRLYCNSYQASGKTAEVVYSGTICSLEKPFTIDGTIAAIELVYPFKFVPSEKDKNIGTFSFNTKWKMATMEGSGTYTIEGLDSGKPVIKLETNSSGTIPQGTLFGSGPTQITLLPLTKGCDGKAP